MYKKLIDLQGQLQADKKQLEKDIERLRALADQPAPSLFDEVLAASRITAAKTDDHLNGTKTVDDVMLKVDKERTETAKKINAITADKAKAQQQLTLKAAALQAADTEINRLSWKIKELIAAAAKERVIGKIADYGRIAADLMTALIEIDALNAIINEDPTGDMAADRTLITDPNSSLSFEVAMYRQYRQIQYEISLAWGVANFKPESTAILLG